MKLDDVYIKKIISEYKDTLSENSTYKFRESIVRYVRNWPKQQYYCNEDICQDFVVYVLEHTEQILRSFPTNSSVSFLTWFNAVLYNKFCDFVKQGTVSSQEFILGGDWYDQNYYAVLTGNYYVEHTDRKLVWEDIINYLSPEEKSLWLFYYMPQQLNSDLLLELTHYTNKPLQEIFVLYQESLKTQYSSYQLQEAYYQKIKDIDFRIAHMENIIQKQGLDKDTILVQKILRLKNRQYKYIRSLKIVTKKSFKVFVKLFKDYNHAYRVLRKIDLNIKKIVQHYHMGS